MDFSEDDLTMRASLFCSAVAAEGDDDNSEGGGCPATCPNCGRACTKVAGHRMPHYCSVDKAFT